MEELPEPVKALVQKGYNNIGKENTVTPGHSEVFERKRILDRKWRHVYGEARFDIPECLHQYVDWTMPDGWHAYRRPIMIKRHQFEIRIPGFCPIAVVYKQFANSADWYFAEFEIMAPHSTQRVHSTRYYDLPLFLAIARELHKPRRQEVKCEEIEGGLHDNVNLIKMNDVKKNSPTTTKGSGYVLTEQDFLQQQYADDDGMPIYA